MPVKDFQKDWAELLGINDELQDKLDTERVERELAQQDTVQEQSFLKEEVIALAQTNLNFLGCLAMPTVFTYLFPAVLLTAWQLLLQLTTVNDGSFPQVALGIPRGHGKTTLIKLYILFCILYTKKKFILVTAINASMAENIIADVFDMLEEPNIVSAFGDWRIGSETNRNDLKKFGFRGRNIIVAGIGAEGSLRGLNLKNERPDVMIFEDIQSRECADSKQQSDNLIRWMIGTAMKAKSPRGCIFIFSGNMYPTNNSILKQLKDNPKWTKFISGAILADGRALWPAHRSLESLIDELDNDIAAGHPEIFFAEVLNDTEAGTNSSVDFSLIPKWPYQSHEQPQGKFIVIDPSGDKAGSDLVAIGYFEVYDEKPALREVIEEKLSPGNTIRAALLLALRTGTKFIAVESISYQYSLLYWFEQICEQLNIQGMQIQDIYPGSASKNYRISAMCKALTSGELILHDSVRANVLKQISDWNPLRRTNVDNILDLLTYAPKIVGEFGPLIASDFDLVAVEAQAEGVIEDNYMF